MRLIETVCAVFALSVFAGVCASAIRPLRQTIAETERISREYDCGRFVAGGFRKLCGSNASEAEFTAWKKWCSEQWQLGGIEITSAGFVPEGNRVLRCVWNYGGKEKQVLAEQKEEL